MPFITDDFKFLTLKLKGDKYNCWGGTVQGTARDGSTVIHTIEPSFVSPVVASRYLLDTTEHEWYIKVNPKATDADDLKPDLTDDPIQEENVDTSDLFTLALENLRVGDTDEAAHSLRVLADAVELEGGPDIEELRLALDNFSEALND